MASRMHIGQLNRRLELQQPSGTAGDGYATVTTVWGEVRSAGGSEVLKFGGPSASGQAVITIRFRSDVRSEWRVREPLTGRAFQIANYGDPDGSRRWLQVFCQELQ